MDDIKLQDAVVKAIRGDERAFARICEYKGRHILYLCVKIMGNYHDGEDAAQEVLLLMQRDIVKLQNPEAFKTWLYRLIVRNCGKMKKKLQQQTSLPIENFAENIWESNEDFLPEDFAETKANKQLVMAAIDDLPDDCRTCLLLFYFENLKYTEIAQTLGVTTNDVGNLLAKAKKLLRRALDKAAPPTTGKQAPFMAAMGGVPLLSRLFAEDAGATITNSTLRQFFKESGIKYLATGVSVAWKAALGTLAAGLATTLVVVTVGNLPTANTPVSLSAASPAASAPVSSPLVVRTLDEMLGQEDADTLRNYGGQESVSTHEMHAFLSRIGMREEFEGFDPSSQESYRLLSLYRGGKLLMVVLQSNTATECNVAFRFTDDTEPLLKHIETYLYFGQWKEEQSAY